MLQHVRFSLVTAASAPLLKLPQRQTGMCLSPLGTVARSGSQKLVSSAKKREAKPTGFPLDSYYSARGRGFLPEPISRSHPNARLVEHGDGGNAQSFSAAKEANSAVPLEESDVWKDRGTS